MSSGSDQYIVGPTAAMAATPTSLVFYVNGIKVVEHSPDPTTTLLHYLRRTLNLTGTKNACDQGGCGACTVMLSWWDQEKQTIKHASVNACLVLICSLHGYAVTTVEGVGGTRAGLSQIQKRLIESFGIQCGFCTPGMVMSMHTLLQTDSNPSEETLETAIEGNLCRCTGYRPIIEAFRTFCNKECSKENGCTNGAKENGYTNGAKENGCTNGAKENGYTNGAKENGCTNGAKENGCTNGDIEDLCHISIDDGCESEAKTKQTAGRHFSDTILKFATSLSDCDVIIKSDQLQPITIAEIREQTVGCLQFPKELQSKLPTEGVEFRSGDWAWFRPVTLAEVVRLLDKHSDGRIIMGGTSLGAKLKSRTITRGTLISCTHVPEMAVFHQRDDGIELGAALTLSDIYDRLQESAPSLNGRGTRGHVVQAMRDSLKWLACQQIRNVATLGGHIMISDPRSDLCVVLMAASAKAVVASTGGTRIVELDNNFFTGNGQSSLKSTDVLVSVIVPFNHINTRISYYKQSQRKGFDYAILNSCLSATLSEGGTIEELNICLGGAFATTRKLITPSSVAKGRFPDDNTLRSVCYEIVQEFELEPCGNISEYKQKLACGFVFKFWREIQNSINHNKRPEVNGLPSIPCNGQQVYAAPSPGQPAHDAVGRPVPLVTAPALVSGEAMFFDDMPKFERDIMTGATCGEGDANASGTPDLAFGFCEDALYLQPVLSTRAHARILDIDRSLALSSTGVVDFLDVSSVPGENLWGLFVHDEPLFAENEVFCVGQAIGAVVATSEHAAKVAADLVKVTYEDLPSIITLEDAIKAESYFDYTSHPIECGEPDKHFDTCDFVREGQIRSGFQEHFYMEPSGALVIPKNESGEMEIFTTSQALTFCQATASRILGIPRNRIVVRQKRLGGGFGGREYRTPLMFGAVAIAAQKWGKPVRTVMDRSTDFKTTGKRHPFMTKYKAGFRSDGTLEAVSIHIYVNAGYTLDVSAAILDNACFNVDAAYKTPVLSVYGHVCKTHTPSNTSMRAFGAAEAVFVMEAILCSVADTVGLDQETVRKINMYREGSLTHYKRKLENCMLQRCWDECIIQSQFEDRKKAVEEHNRHNDYRKKGIAVMPLKFGVGYPVRHQNQGAALVNIYLDGSVTIAHGGVEMGQGLHTKMIQVASRALGIPMDSIHISETGTNTVPNTTSTAASLTSDLQGAAILDACTKINERLQPYKDTEPNGQWVSWVNAAYMDRISLSATGLGRSGDQQWDFGKGIGNPVHYYTYGAACTEVEIDCLTGDHQVVDTAGGLLVPEVDTNLVLSTDIVMDIGNSLNPALDVGQIEGGFVQGYGWVTMEELKVSSTGHLMASGPVDYKIPGVRNIPRQLKVSILKDCPNKGTVYSSKGIGEPPLLLSLSVYIALREAIRACRMDAGLSGPFDLDIPLTSEKIRMACPIEIPYKKEGV